MPDYTILLIDYEPRSIERLRRPLERAGYRIEIAHDGISAIKRFEELKPDLTLIEAMIPKKHGFEVCQELKRTAHGKESAVLIITSVYKGRRYRIQATHYYGCDDYLEKPISDETLLEVVRKHLGEPTEPESAEVEADGSAPESSGNDEPSAGTEPESKSSERLLDATEKEILDHLDNVLPSDTGGSSSGQAVGDVDAPLPDALDKPDSSPMASVPDEAGIVVDFNSVRARPRGGDSEPRRPVKVPSAGATGAPVGGGAQPALAPERPIEPQAETAKIPEPIARRGGEPEASEPKPGPSGVRGRLFLWIAFALLIALGALLSAIVFL
jgi:DNA-binding response OmpR family regulator